MCLEGELGISKMMSIFSSVIKNNDPATENGSGMAERVQLLIFLEGRKRLNNDYCILRWDLVAA